MANVLDKTEAFNDTGEWSAFDGLVVTANTHAAPAFAGVHAGLADTVEDTNGGVASSLYGPFKSIPSDSSDWIISVHVRKDATTSRFPHFAVDFDGGTGFSAGVQLNTSTGEVANSGSAPDAIGVVDVDATWWRVWMRKANNGSGNNIARFNMAPCFASTLGGSVNGGLTGSIVMWGVNMTNASTIQTYEPDPFYEFTGRIVIAPVGFA
jgi:hypothetical protein